MIAIFCAQRSQVSVLCISPSAGAQKASKSAQVTVLDEVQTMASRRGKRVKEVAVEGRSDEHFDASYVEEDLRDIQTEGKLEIPLM